MHSAQLSLLPHGLKPLPLSLVTPLGQGTFALMSISCRFLVLLKLTIGGDGSQSLAVGSLFTRQLYRCCISFESYGSLLSKVNMRAFSLVPYKVKKIMQNLV